MKEGLGDQAYIPVNMPLVASTGPVLAHNGMLMGYMQFTFYQIR